MGNANDAHRQHLEESLICPHCDAANRAGCLSIALSAEGLALCDVCSHAWRIDLRLSVNDMLFLKQLRVDPM